MHSPSPLLIDVVHTVALIGSADDISTKEFAVLLKLQLSSSQVGL
jgi:hypothetical protein